MDLFADVYSFAWQISKLSFYVSALMVFILHSSASQSTEQDRKGKKVDVDVGVKGETLFRVDVGGEAP